MSELFLSESFADNGEHSHYDLIDGQGVVVIEDVEGIKKQLTELAEAAEVMLTLLVDNKPIEGLFLSSIDEWDYLIKEVIK